MNKKLTCVLVLLMMSFGGSKFSIRFGNAVIPSKFTNLPITGTLAYSVDIAASVDNNYINTIGYQAVTGSLGMSDSANNRAGQVQLYLSNSLDAEYYFEFGYAGDGYWRYFRVHIWHDYWSMWEGETEIEYEDLYIDVYYTANGGASFSQLYSWSFTTLEAETNQAFYVTMSWNANAYSTLQLQILDAGGVRWYYNSWSYAIGQYLYSMPLKWTIVSAENGNGIYRMRLLYINSAGTNVEPLELYTVDDNVGITDAIQTDNPEDALGNEPTGDYWAYTSYKLQEGDEDTLFPDASNTNANYTFTFLEGVGVSSKFYYVEDAIQPEELGDWGAIWNWLRAGLCKVLNLIYFAFQFLFYILIVAFNVLVLYLPVMYIIPFFWNVICYYVVFAFVYVIYWVVFWLKVAFWIFWDFLQWLWDLIYAGLVWIWDNIIYPFFDWLWNDVIVPFFTWLYQSVLLPIFQFLIETVLPAIILIVVVVFSFLLALFLWLVTLCQADFDTLFDQVLSMNLLIADSFVNLFLIFVNNIIAFVEYIATYLILVGFLFVRLVYVRSKGYVNRGEQLEKAFEVYLLPIKWGVTAIKKIWELFPTT